MTIEARASWMISSYRNVTIGGSTPNNAEAQKFGWADVLARLHLNPADPAPVNRFVSLMTASTQFNGAFMPCGAAWILCKFWDRFTPEQRAVCLRRFKSASAVVNVHGTENHFLIRNVGAFLWGELWPDESGWPGGRTSEQLRTFTKARLLTFLRDHYNKGYHEHLSINYLPVHLYPLQALYNCVKDPELKAAADAVLTLHAVEMAANFFQGSTIYPWSRDAEQRASDPQRNTALNTHLKAMYWLWWAELMNTPSTTTATFVSAGARGWGGEARHFALASALSSWRPPALCLELAQVPIDLKGSAPCFGENSVGDPAYVSRTVWRERSFAAGSANYVHNINDSRPARGAGLSQKNGCGVLLATRKPQHEIVVTHPYWRSNAAEYRWLSRSSPFQQNVQHQGTIISLFNIPATDPFARGTNPVWERYRDEGMIQQAWIRWPKAVDEYIAADGWHFIREGETYVAMRAAAPATVDAGEFPDMMVLRSAGATNATIVDVATAAEFGSFAAFRQTVLDAPLVLSLTAPTVTYRNVRGQTITATWGAFNLSDRVVQSTPRMLLNGQPQLMRDPDFVAGRATMKSEPLSLIGRMLTVRLPSGGLTVDWRGGVPVFSGAAEPAPPPAPPPDPDPAPPPAPLTLAQRIAAELPCSAAQAMHAITLCADRLQQLRRTPAADALRREAQ